MPKKKKKAGQSKDAKEPAPPAAYFAELENMRNKGMSDDDILSANGLTFPELHAWKKAFTTFDPHGTGGLRADAIVKIFEGFEMQCDPEDTADIISNFTNKKSTEVVPYLEFVLFLHTLMKVPKSRRTTFGYAFGMFAGKATAKDIKVDKVKAGFSLVGMPMDDDELTEFMATAKKKTKFVQAMTAQAQALTKKGSSTHGKKSKATKPKKAAAAVTIDPKDPKYKKYFKMKSMHLPAAAALGKAKMDGLSEGELDALKKML